MNRVQFDKNTGDRRLVAACLEEGTVECGLLPPDIRDADDAAVLEYVISREFVMFTFDRDIHVEWGHLLAGRNPGILILRKDDEALAQINTKTAPRHISEFKSSFPDWHVVPYRHSVVELTPTLVFVYHTLGNRPVRTWWGRRDQPGWQNQLTAHLRANADAHPL